MFNILFGILLLVTSTATGGQIPYHPTQDMRKFNVTVIVVHPKRINYFCRRLTGNNEPVKACAQWNVEAKTCNLIVPIPSMSKFECATRDSVTQICDTYKSIPNAVVDGEMLNSWGHELLHCVKGLYHD